jgi:hypothetical protein
VQHSFQRHKRFDFFMIARGGSNGHPWPDMPVGVVEGASRARGSRPPGWKKDKDRSSICNMMAVPSRPDDSNKWQMRGLEGRQGGILPDCWVPQGERV